MFKHHFFLLFSIVFISCLCTKRVLGQTWYVQRTISEKITFTVGEKNNQLVLEVPAIKSSGFLIIEELILDDADLVIVYQTDLPKGTFNYSLEWSLTELVSGKILTQMTLTGNPEITSQTKQQFRFQDLTENGLFLGASYQLTIIKQLLGTINCDLERPEFTLQKKLLPTAGAVIGLGMVGIGELIYKNQQESLYSNYTNLWEGGAKDGAGFLRDAENARNTRKVFSIGGGAIAAGGILWYFIRKHKIKSQQRLFDEYCGTTTSSLSIQPVSFPFPINQGFGLQFSYQF